MCSPAEEHMAGIFAAMKTQEKVDSIKTSRWQPLTLEASWTSHLGQPWAQAAPNQFGIGQPC